MGYSITPTPYPQVSLKGLHRLRGKHLKYTEVTYCFEELPFLTRNSTNMDRALDLPLRTYITHDSIKLKNTLDTVKV